VKATRTTLRNPLGNVLVAVDLSAAGTAVVERAASLPVTPGAAITVFHVVATPGAGAEDEARRALAAHAARLSAVVPASVTVGTALAEGSPFVEIIRRARRERAELVVLGRHGHRGFAEALIGTTAERVLRKGDVPVLIVGDTPPGGAYRSPLIAVDLSDTSRRALALTLRLIDPRVETVDVVHVWDARTAGDPLEREGAALSTFLADFSEAAVVWRPTLAHGDARAVILAEASRSGCDLLALGTHGRSGLAHVLIGSVAEAVTRAATCDVLVAHAPSRAFQLP
jgi:nucleotide-binding universal stress UspA family protein